MNVCGLRTMGLIEESLRVSGKAIANRWEISLNERQRVDYFFANLKIKPSMIAEQISARCQANCPSGHVLLIQDTSEFNYHHLIGRLRVQDQDIGLLSNNTSIGKYLHVGLAVDAEGGIPFGIAGMEGYVNSITGPSAKERDYKNQPILEKKTGNWLKVSKSGKEVLSNADRITVIGDRESDIYEYLLMLEDQGMDWVIRKRVNRESDQGKRIEALLEEESFQVGKKVEVSANKYRQKREAVLSYRWKSVVIKRPLPINESLRESIEMRVVEIWEDPATMENDDEPIHWYLWTSHPVETLEDAIQIGEYYTQRWWIEDTFRVGKTKGFEVESSHLGTGQKLEKLMLMVMEQAWKVLLLREERDGKLDLEAETCFDKQQCQFLQQLHETKYNQGTKKQRNPHRPQSLAWAIWMIARMAGWNQPYTYRPPGVITIARGLIKFNSAFEGWSIANKIRSENPNLGT